MEGSSRAYHSTVIVLPLLKLDPGVGEVIAGVKTSRAALSTGEAIPVMIAEKTAKNARRMEGTANFIMTVGGKVVVR